MIFRWDQELLVYHFSIVHQINKMMAYINTLTKILLKLIAKYCIIASIL